MARKPSLSKGDKFNYVTVVEYVDKKTGYELICDCGNTTFARGWDLTSGKRKSCGCKSGELQAKRQFRDDFMAVKNVLYKNYKAAARRRNYSFDLTKEQYNDMITSKCHYCGCEPNMTYHYQSDYIDYSQFKYNGVDRVDNTIGYTTDNSVPCCKICNNAKSTLPMEDWLDWLKRIYQHLQLEGSTTIPEMGVHHK